jgi:hypothetical protein
MSRTLLVSASALACALSLLAVVPANDASAATLTVTNCQDTGSGSLRSAVARAISGDTIDMTSLRCERILLLSDAIQVRQSDLTLLGPGRALLIDGNRAHSVVRHDNTGSLLIRNLSIGYGAVDGDGGCIASAGDVLLQNVAVHDCLANEGGGIYASGLLTVVDSDVYSNTAADYGGGLFGARRVTLRRSRIFENNALRFGIGGGIFALRGIRAFYSEISDNSAPGAGGIFAGGSSTISHSAILRNRGLEANGALLFDGEDAQMLIADSTISGNTAPWRAGVAMIGRRTSKAVLNSTIVFNRQRSTARGCVGALYVQDAVLLDSTIVARNLCDDQPADIVVAQVQGANNLIEAATVPVPADTISADPRLAPLADNGGPTLTRALLSDSPAIDMGSNVGGLETDQRGPGFPRVKGGRADIGAFESR